MEETWSIACLMFAVLLGGLAQNALSGEQKRAFSIATRGIGGVWCPLGGSISSVVNQKVPGIQATAESTTAVVDTRKLLVNKRVGMAFCEDYQIAFINEGKLAAVSDKVQAVRLVIK